MTEYKSFISFYVEKVFPFKKLDSSVLERIVSWDALKEYLIQELDAQYPIRSIEMKNRKFSSSVHPVDNFKKVIKKHVFF